jgi:hypothetical protein
MNSDCAFWIGKTHPICQDYALAGTGQGMAYAIVCDGCSSSLHTDIGARLLAKTTEGLLQNDDAQEAVTRAACCAELLGLPLMCLDATLLTVWASEDTFTARCYGDGVVALGHLDGAWEAFVVTYAANYPRYPSYLRDSARSSLWGAQPGNVKQIEHWQSTQDGLVTCESTISDQEYETYTGNSAEVQFVAVLSDGVQSFTEVAVPDVLAALLSFKNHAGQFVQRRAQAFLKGCAKTGWQSHDDVSLGVVWLGA